MKKLLFLLAITLIALGMSLAQTSSGSANSGGTAAQGSSSSDQNAAGTPSSSTADQNAATPSSSSDQNGTAAQGNDANGNANNLPQTASPLPLLALLGMGSLGSGLISRFRK